METSDDVTGPINLGNPEEFTLNELATEVTEMVGNGLAVEHLALPEDDPVRRRPDIDLARQVLGWDPTVTLDDGLSRTVEYFRTLLTV